jgi:hypothetical protein
MGAVLVALTGTTESDQRHPMSPLSERPGVLTTFTHPARVRLEPEPYALALLLSEPPSPLLDAYPPNTVIVDARPRLGTEAGCESRQQMEEDKTPCASS